MPRVTIAARGLVVDAILLICGGAAVISLDIDVPPDSDDDEDGG